MRRPGKTRWRGLVRGIAMVALGAFPLVLRAAELPRTILFVDDEDVLYRPGTIKRVMEFRKHSADPVIAPDRRWEGMIGWTSVYRNPETGKYQLWYQAYQEREKADKSLKCVVCYAESDDGVSWVKPEFGLFPFYDEKRTNIVLVGAGGKEGGYGDRYCNSVVVDPRDPDPARRYKMAYYDWNSGEGGKGGAGTHVAFSPDGIHWTKHEAGAVMKTAFGGKGQQPPFAGDPVYRESTNKDGRILRSWAVPIGVSDALDVFFDERIQKFVGYGKSWSPGPDGGMVWKHGMARVESSDFIEWSKPQFILTTDDRDEPHVEFHTSPVFPRHGLYLSLNQMLDRGAGTIDVELMSSRDGVRWDRRFASQWVIARGDSDRFDAGSIISNGTPIFTDTETRFYYAAYRGTATGGVGLNRQVLGSTDYFSGVGLAVTPRDRLVAVGVNPRTPVKGQKRGAPQLINTIGQVTLRPLDFAGATELTVNADARYGSVRIELLDEDGFRLRGFTRDDAVALKTDGLDLAARWGEKSLRDLPPGRYQVRVHLERADLFAVTLR